MPAPSPSVTKHDVIALNRAHPDWTVTDIAQELGCMREYVTATGHRNGLKFASAKSGPRAMSDAYRVSLLLTEIKAAITDVDFLRHAVVAGDEPNLLLERCDDLSFHLKQAVVSAK